MEFKAELRLNVSQMFPRLRAEETMFPQQCFRNNVSSFAEAFMCASKVEIQVTLL